MHRILITLALGLAAAAPALAEEEPKLPLKTDDGGSLYVAPKVTPTEKAADTNGATVGVQKADGSGRYLGVDTSGTRPTYSLGGSTAGDLSYSAGVFSDGKENKGVKAGVTIKY